MAPASGMQHKEAGQPFIRNFDPAEYKGAPQNWAITQDHRGVIYIGNVEDGVLSFDGARWRRIAIPNRSAVRSLATGADGRVYVGAAGELGYLDASAAGQMHYVSLLDRIPAAARDFTDVWQILPTDEGVYFSTFTHLFRLDGRQVKVWNPETAFHIAFRVRNKLYIRQVDRGLMQLVDDELVPVAGGERFAGEKIYAMLPWGPAKAKDSGEVLIGTRNQGWFVFDGTHYRRWTTEIDDALKRDLLYSATWLADGTLAVATLQGGLRILDRQGRLLLHLDKAHGLANDVVTALFQDRQQGLWLSLDAGVARVDIASPITHFADLSGLRGAVLSVQRHAGQLHVGTTHGLFRLETGNGKAHFVQIADVPGQSWGMLDLGPDLLVANSNGVFEVRGDSARLIRPTRQTVYTLLRSKRHPARVFVSMQDGLASLRRDNGRWVDEGRIPGVQGGSGSLFEDADARLWLGNWSGGVQRLTFPPEWNGGNDSAAPGMESFDTRHGFPPGQNQVQSIDGKLRFASEDGVLLFDESSGRFFADPRFASLFPNGARQVSLMRQHARGGLWMHTADREQNTRETGRALADRKGIQHWSATALQPLSGHVFNDILVGDDNVVWLGGDKGLFRYDASMDVPADPLFAALIREMSGRNGRSYLADARTGAAPDIAYADNALRFEFSAPSYDNPEANRFQVLLEGLDRSWSAWSSEAYRDYTNIPEGDYRFRVRARNVHGDVGAEAAYAFNVLPPWYRTWWASLGYASLLALLLWSGFRWRSATLRARNAALAQLVALRTDELSSANIALRDANAALAEQSFTDPLTGLRNRRYVLDHVDHDLAATCRQRESPCPDTRERNDDTRLLFLMIDIDNFKEVNDRHGHAAGDRVLEQFRDILLAATRETDTAVRWGGEEFLVLARFAEPASGPVLAERIRRMTAEYPFKLGDGRTLHRTCSIGFAAYPFFAEEPNGLGWEEVVNLADECLYAAKHNGRDAWVGVSEGKAIPNASVTTALHRSLKLLPATGPLAVITSLSSGTAQDAPGRD